MKKVSICVVLVVFTTLIIGLCYHIDKLIDCNNYTEMSKYHKSDYIYNIAPQYDFEHLVDYEGSEALKFQINKDTGLEIGKELTVTAIKNSLNARGIDVSSNIILGNTKFNIDEEMYSDDYVYRIGVYAKKIFVPSIQNKMWNGLVADEIGAQTQVIIDKSNGKVYKCVLNGEEIDLVIDEGCASYIAAIVLANNYMNDYKKEYILDTVSTVNTATGIAYENETQQDFYQVCRETRISLNYFLALNDYEFLNNKFISALKNNYKILIRKNNAEIIKVWKY